MQALNVHSARFKILRSKFKLNLHKYFVRIYPFLVWDKCHIVRQKSMKLEVTAFNIRLNNHRKDTKDPNAILACRHFQQQGQNFNIHAKFIITDKLVNTLKTLKTSGSRN